MVWGLRFTLKHCGGLDKMKQQEVKLTQDACTTDFLALWPRIRAFPLALSDMCGLQGTELTNCSALCMARCKT